MSNDLLGIALNIRNFLTMKITYRENERIITKTISVGKPLTGVAILAVELAPEEFTPEMTEYLQWVIFPRILSLPHQSESIRFCTSDNVPS